MPSPSDPAVRASIDDLVHKEQATYGGRTPVRAALIGVWDGKGNSYIHAYGSADLATRRRLTPEDHFRIGSNTNFLILGLIIESLTKDSVGDQIRKRLIDKFGLSRTSYPATQAMPHPWAHGYGPDKNKNWEDVSGTIPVSLMGAAGEMVSDMRDMVRWTKLYVTGKTNGPATQRERMHCISTGEGNLSFGLGIGCSAGYYGYTGGLSGRHGAASRFDVLATIF